MDIRASRQWEGVAFPRDFDHAGAVERASRTGMYDPWEHVNELNLDVQVERWSGSPLGLTNFKLGTVQLHADLCQSEMRATLAHELVHVERGPFCESMREQEENVVENIAALRLITFDAFLSAAKWCRSWGEMADELVVDLSTAKRRARLLTRSERAIVRAAVAG